ncbi:MAG: molybdenum cofactor biosynthesis protein MoaE [Desulfovibrio sp.]|nr:molybdenum cofactor biosynthesis protein MoaE [Desulfovibrio sp.]MCA1986258.1 molybdenum cofactor biosynthesis protein MoaE [Desulfovibrio sp.]
MDITKTIEALKATPGFAEHVGMILVHNGVVRGWSRKEPGSVAVVDIAVDRERVEQVRQEIEQRPGIFRVVVEYHEGALTPGDDVLYLIVAGDIREHVIPALSDLLDRVKAEAVTKKENMTPAAS